MAASGDGGVGTSAGANPQSEAVFQRIPTILTVVLFAALFFALTSPAFDSDFWWHLASGRWMWEHRELLRADPFDFTSRIFGGSSQSGYQLTQYWLAQVLLYCSYLLAGLKGVVLLRAALFTALFYLLYRVLRRTGAGAIPCVLLLALAVQTIVNDLYYIAARPQMWSSFFFVVLLYVLEPLREGKPWARFALPALMLLWANLHGGYILGVIVIVITAAEALLSRHGERRMILLVALAAIALTGCNPTGYTALISYPLTRFSHSPAAKVGIFEEDSLFTYVKFTKLHLYKPWLTVVFLLPLLTLLPRVRSLLRERRDLLLLYLLTLGMGISAKRFMVFLVPMACWLTAVNVAALRERLRRPLFRFLPFWIPGALTVAALVSLSALYASMAARTSALRPGADYRHEVEGAVDYLARSGIKGNIFNHYEDGGYLAWRLPPEMKMFIYGRMVYPELLTIYNDVVNYPSKTFTLDSSGAGRYYYQNVLDEYGINAVIIPAGESLSGDGVPLTMMLARDNTWALVYARPEALVFLRKTPEVAPLLRGALPKSAIYESQIVVARAAAETAHGRSSPVWRRSLVMAYYGLGRKEEALRMLDEYLALAPDDPKAIQFRDRILREVGRAAR